MNRLLRISCLAAAALMSGCMVEERLAWAPDGQRAAVWGHAGLFLADPDARLHGPIATAVTAAVWLPGGHDLVAHREHRVRKWAEAASLLPEVERRRIEAFAPVVAAVLSGALEVSTNGLDGLDEAFAKPLGLSADATAIAPALLCLRDRDPAGWSNLVLRARKPAEPPPDDTLEVIVHELALIPTDPPGPPQVLYRTYRPISAIRASPVSRAVAFRAGRVLYVLAVGERAQEPTIVAERVSGRFDWAPDGASLTYAVPLGEADEGGLHLAHVQSTTLQSAEGRLVVGATVAHLLAAFPFPPRLRYLGDRRLVFPALGAALPRAAGAGAEGQRPALFVARWAEESPDSPRIERLATDGLPADLRDFEPSPDGRRIAVVESGSDAVALLEVATGRIRVLQPAGGGRTRALPAWRTPEELYFAALPAAGPPPEWRRWTSETVTSWSVGWPTGLVERLVERETR
ncbi:MAG: hypothetical protein N2652_04325 [Kiritimatiellae bacterium]|nr:hypothetical protein [Kiritimatiellia bacterium]